MKASYKSQILDELIKRTEEDLDKAKEVFEASHNLVTSPELKSEGKYDTRGIEAGYLAGAQKRRVEELEQDICLLKEIELNHSNSQVGIGSLVLLSLNDKERYYFISTTSGGTVVDIEENHILVISAFSPIGAGAIGLSSGDNFEVELGDSVREYKILQIL